ncbi:leucyl aminopeptidase [Pasteurellaceae bacterium RH1A]|nr:leucyl aminopeptidase [Pasteurellaceae bacterium RH1A]
MQELTFLFPNQTQAAKTLYIGLGDQEKLTLDSQSEQYDAQCIKTAFSIADLQDLGTLAASQFSRAQALNFVFDLKVFEQISPVEVAQWLAFGLHVASYKYQHKTKAAIDLPACAFSLSSDDQHLQQAVKNGQILANAQLISRELMNLPANVLYPVAFVGAVKALGLPGIECEVLSEKALEEQKFGGLLSISQGSAKEAQVLILRYRPAVAQASKHLALVGKGVTFDTGGISIKPARFMSTMKFDMGGAAAVIGAMYAISALALPLNVTGLCGLVENMPSSTAIKPGDVVMMRSGTSVEFISTDAEGRMVLADVLDYAQETLAPDYLIDIATLTGGAGIALGKGYSALMGNHDDFISQIKAAGKTCGEPVWHMPTGDWFKRPLECHFADLRHGGEDPHGSPCVAATFLEYFVKPNQPWAHLDIAAMSYEMGHRKIYGETASGYGALLLTHVCQHLSQQEGGEE